MLVLEGQAATRANQTWVTHALTWDHVVVQSQTVAMGTARICVNICDSCCHPRLSGCLGSGLPPEDMLTFGGHAATGAMLIWVIRTVNQGHGDIRAQAAAKNHVCGPTIAEVCIDAHGFCYHRNQQG